MEINKSSRHAKIVGDLGEQFVCNWLSRSGWEVVLVDHTGIDIIAYHRKSGKRIGITVKSRTRTAGTEKDTVNIFNTKKDDRRKVLQACEYFACEPWIAIYVEKSDSADLFLTSLNNYDEKYQLNGDRAIEDWKMGEKYLQKYALDPNIHYLRLKVESHNWYW
jgi:Holliday junction resolvase-like predicted endonuclease